MTGWRGISKTTAAIVAVAIVIAAGVGAFILATAPPTAWALAQGAGTVSDGRVAVTIGESWLEFRPMFSTAVETNPFLLVNVTFKDVGAESTTVGEAWYVEAIWQGVAASPSWYTFGGSAAMGMLPVASTVAPGQAVSGWLGFLLDANDHTGIVGSLQIQKLVFLETTYGGQPTPDGSWVGVHQVLVRFEVTPA